MSCRSNLEFSGGLILMSMYPELESLKALVVEQSRTSADQTLLAFLCLHITSSGGAVPV